MIKTGNLETTAEPILLQVAHLQSEAPHKVKPSNKLGQREVDKWLSILNEDSPD